MRLNSAIALVFVFAACNSAPSTPATEAAKVDSSAAVKPINSPYEIMYSSKFTIDDPKNAESVLALWKAYDDGNLSTTKDLIADSIEVYLSSGGEMKSSRDSMIAGIQGHRNSFKSAVDRVNAVMAVKSTDRNEHWVLIWGTEIDTHKDGKVDSTELQETWRFAADGRANLLFQYSRPAGPMKR
ncbi:MAG TPA: hypothetical protein VGM89_07210 [Puia sp.]